MNHVLELAGAGRTQAYDLLPRVREVLPSLLRSPGRPAGPTSERTTRELILRTVLEYSFAHRDAVRDAGERRIYSDGFRAFILDLMSPGQLAEHVSLHELSELCQVPFGTLKDWHRAPLATEQASGDEAQPSDLPEATCTSVTIYAPHLQIIMDEWAKWKGPFCDFCHMLRTEQRLDYCDTFIGNCLQALNLRNRKRRRRTVEAPWSSETFRAMFPGAQWLGDGTSIAIRWGHSIFVFNVEALLDVASNGTVGFHVSDCEDAQTLCLAYEMGKQTTGAPPVFVSLDNRPSNHSPESQAALAESVIVPSTPFRGQAKAPLEGSFGLFQQSMPPLVVDGDTQREMARAVLTLIMTAWYRGRNGRPRKRLGKLSPAEAYFKNAPTEEDIEAARTWRTELLRRRDEARQTRAARRDPVRLGMLMQGLAELGIEDPESRLAVTLAFYSRDSIAQGLAVFHAKLKQGTIPPSAEHGRYLGGIIRNLHTRLELEATALYLLEQRIRLRDLTLQPLTQEAARLRSQISADALPQALIDRALAATWEVDFRFWSQNAATALASLPNEAITAQYRSLVRRVAATFKTDRRRREDLIARLAQATTNIA